MKMNTAFHKAYYDVLAYRTEIHFLKQGKVFFVLPASVCVNDTASQLTLSEATETQLLYSGENELLNVQLLEDCAVVSYEKKWAQETPIFQVNAFTGMNLVGFDRAFCPQPRNNGLKNMDYYHHLPDISSNGYYTPSVLEFSIGSPDGWVSLGLLDLPDTKICRLEEDFSFLIESCGGNKVIPAGEAYHMPRVLITFPQDEWHAISLFREKLMEFGLYTPKTVPFSQLPAWWKNPFVCTYGDQLIEHRVGQKIDEKWVEEFVSIAENEWGMSPVNLIIDDSWQLPHALDPAVDTNRFPDLRGMIDRLHERGHHVILWLTPLFDKISNGFVTKTQELGALSEYKLTSPYFNYFPGCYSVDYTSDSAEAFLEHLTATLFGSGEGQLNADGVKLDFLANLRDPALTNTYEHPERGVGIKELLRFYEIFNAKAKAIKPDVLLDSTVGDPRFEHLISLNRLHDTHCGTIEKEMRARIALLACPGLPLDSDGALMYNEWLKVHYISAAVYGIPSNYYLKCYHDFYQADNDEEVGLPSSTITPAHLSLQMKQHLGTLFQMVRHKPDGVPEMERLGEWILRDGDKINGISQRGETVVYYPTESNKKGYIFTFQDEVICLPLHGRKFSNLSPAPVGGFCLVDYARDQVILRLTPGVLHTFEDRDDGSSIDRSFSGKALRQTETEMNYVNG